MRTTRATNYQIPALFLGSVAAFLIPWFWSQHAFLKLGNPAVITGWWLFAVILFLGLFNARKKLSTLPLGRASTWLAWHVIFGFLTLALFWLHARSLWPTGLYEQVLAAVFYGVVVSGIVGWWMQRIYPRHLTDTGGEIIFEKIPTEIARLRESAEALMLESARETGSDTLSRHYLETFHWFFRKPRFFANHALSGGKKARAWVRQQCDVVRLYLSEAERGHLEKLRALAEQKADVDAHYTLQALMKRWLLVHLPLTAVLLLMIVWHILMVHIYSL
jgi:hypothetical protein